MKNFTWDEIGFFLKTVVSEQIVFLPEKQLPVFPQRKNVWKHNYFLSKKKKLMEKKVYKKSLQKFTKNFAEKN